MRLISIQHFEDPGRDRLKYLRFSKGLVPQLHWLASVQSVGDLNLRVPWVLHFLSHADAPPVIETLQRLDEFNQNNEACSITGSTARVVGTSWYSSCVYPMIIR